MLSLFLLVTTIAVFTPRPVGVLSSPLCAAAHSFGYYTNMVRQIKFILHTNIQPLPALFFTQGQGQIFKKNLVNAIT